MAVISSEKVDCGSLSQDEENKASNISSLIEEVGGDLVQALANPSEEQLVILMMRKDDLSWRMKAILCNFDDNKSIKQWFGQTNLSVVKFMHKYLFDSVGDPYAKARVVLAWNKLSKEKQTVVKSVMKLVDDCYKILQEEIDKEERKWTREEKERRKKKQKTTSQPAVATATPEEETSTTRRIEIPSKFVHAMEGVCNLASLRSKPKDRTRYASPTKASHLNSKQARAATEKLEDQFYKSANTIDPKHQPGDETWTELNSMVVTTDQTTSPPRSGFRKENRNIITGNPDAVPTKVRVLVAHGGEEGAKNMFQHLLHTGMFDDEINRYVEQRNSRVIEEFSISSTSREMVTSKEQLHTIRNKNAAERQRAEKQRSAEEVDNDADIGATVTVSDDFL